jgi:hypothetical protein
MRRMKVVRQSAMRRKAVAENATAAPFQAALA